VRTVLIPRFLLKSVSPCLDPDCYELTQGCFTVYGFEYKPGYNDGYISWIANDKVAWTMKAPGMAADTVVEIDARPVPQEPMVYPLTIRS
jgi:beta-glucan synthesis-associated protein KRE6